MRKFVHVAPFGVVLASLIGCATNQGPSVCEQLGFWKCPPKPVSCVADSLDKGGGWELGQLTLSKTADTPIDIRGVKYTPAQVKLLADSVAELEQLRVEHCQDLQTLAGLSGTTPDSVQNLATGFNATYLGYKQRLTQGVLNAKTAEEGLAAAAKVKADAEASKGAAAATTDEVRTNPSTPIPAPALAPSAPSPGAKASAPAVAVAASSAQPAAPASSAASADSAPIAPGSVPPPVAAAASAPIAEVQELTSKVAALQGRLDALQRQVTGQAGGQQRTRMVLDGFEPSGLDLTADARNDAISKFHAYEKAMPSGSQLNASIVGYADQSGGYLANVELGRRRAQAVADLLANACDGVRVESVSSGGVYADRGSGRRVEVFLWATKRA